MGCTVGPENAEAQRKNKQIEQEIKKSKENSSVIIKLLLLGAGESGKSTIVKQMRIIHKNPYTSEEMENFKTIIYENIVRFIHSLWQTAVSLGKEEALGLKEEGEMVVEFSKQGVFSAIPSNIWECCQKIWEKNDIKECIAEAEKNHINPSIKYLADDIPRISASDYVPSDSDILHSRVKTTGIKQIEFKYQNITFQLYDVGGQRSERKKWIHCFEDVTAIIFVASLSDYNQTLEEDNITNRMHESIKIFQSVRGNPWLQECSIILFLNKTDLLEEKIKVTPLTVCFPEYEGDNTLQAASEYIKSRFVSMDKNPSDRDIYTHFTCATDTKQIDAVFKNVTDTIMKKNLREYGLY